METERDTRIVDLFIGLKTYNEIAEMYEISRQRVQQIIKKYVPKKTKEEIKLKRKMMKIKNPKGITIAKRYKYREAIIESGKELREISTKIGFSSPSVLSMWFNGGFVSSKAENMLKQLYPEV